MTQYGRVPLRPRGFKNGLLNTANVIIVLFLVEAVVMAQLLRGSENLGVDSDPGADTIAHHLPASVGEKGLPVPAADAGIALDSSAKKEVEIDAIAAQRVKAKRERLNELHERSKAKKEDRSHDENMPEAEGGDEHALARLDKDDVVPQSYPRGPPPSKFWAKWVKNKKVGFAPEVGELAARPLLHFVMIVRNEAKAIKATIDSVKPYVDHYTILDTGSTDGTQDIIKESFGDVPGEVYQEEFVDFSTTRNRVIELAGLKCVFVFMLSGDESLRMGSALRGFLQAHRGWEWTKQTGHEAYNIQIKYGTDVYDSTRIHRTDAAWYYVGVTHEYMTNAKRQVATRRARDATTGVTPYVFHDLSNNDPNDKRKRWKLDLGLLKGEWDKKPNTTRTAFYIGQTYECLRDYENAFEWYQRRFDLKGWNEEAYEARYRMGRVAKYMKHPWPQVQQHWLDAHAYLPSRAEPLYAIASHYFHKDKNYPLAFMFAQRASQLPFPTHLRLFIDKPVYDYKAHDLVGIVGFYVGEYELGEQSVRKALKLYPNDRRLLKNLGFYLKKKDKMIAAAAARRK